MLKNVLWSLAGQGAPLLAALVCIPILIATLGTDRFAVLAISWAIVGYLSFLDFGLGRALTREIARGPRSDRVSSLVNGGVFLTFGLGAIGGLCLLALGTPLRGWLDIPGALHAEFDVTVKLLAFSVPLVTMTAALRGVLEGRNLFALVNSLRIPLGVLSFAAPVLALPLGATLTTVVGALVAVRAAAWILHLHYVRRALPEAQQFSVPDAGLCKELLQAGGWMTVSNIVGPMMVYFDRFIVGGVLGLSAVTYYTTPYEIVTKLLIIPAAVSGVLFPAFAAMETRDAIRLMRLGVKYLLIALWPIAMLVVLLATPALGWWLNADFAHFSAPVLKWLALGVLINSLAFVPFAYLQAVGRADWTAKLHMLELPVYFVGLWWCLHRYGIEGAAVAWTLRALFDAVVMFYMASRCSGERAELFSVALAAIFGIGSLALGVVVPTFGPAGAPIVGLAFAVFVLAVWRSARDGEWRAIRSAALFR